MAVHHPAIPLVVLGKYLLVGAGATIGSAYVVNLKIKVVRRRARKLSPDQAVTIRRDHKRDRGRDYIRIVIEASGERAEWLAQRIDAALEKLLPTDGAVERI